MHPINKVEQDKVNGTSKINEFKKVVQPPPKDLRFKTQVF